jgi:hypothetical protein
MRDRIHYYTIGYDTKTKCFFGDEGLSDGIIDRDTELQLTPEEKNLVSAEDVEIYDRLLDALKTLNESEL